MKVESRIIMENGQFRFQIVDTSDTLEHGEEVLAEELFYSEGYAREQTAERNASKWIERFNGATEAIRRKMCGYDPISQCGFDAKPRPILRRQS